MKEYTIYYTTCRDVRADNIQEALIQAYTEFDDLEIPMISAIEETVYTEECFHSEVYQVLDVCRFCGNLIFEEQEIDKDYFNYYGGFICKDCYDNLDECEEY